MTRPKLLIIVGPTGAGKSDLALAVAEALRGEVVSADSQQVYRGMDIGTGKVTAEERRHVPHHLIDVLEPDQEMTAARFAELADQAIAGIGGPVVVAGGTGLYVRALMLGLFEGPPADPQVRERLMAECDGDPKLLWPSLQRVDPEAAARIHDTDLKRIVRALEVFELTGTPMSEHQKRHDHKRMPPRYPARWLGVAPPRDELYQRINSRVQGMFQQGLIEEVQGLREAGFGPELRSQAAIGYAEVHQFLDGALDRPAAIELTQRNSRRYARRQLSWYRGDENVEWFASPGEVDLSDVRRYFSEPTP